MQGKLSTRLFYAMEIPMDISQARCSISNIILTFVSFPKLISPTIKMERVLIIAPESIPWIIRNFQPLDFPVLFNHAEFKEIKKSTKGLDKWCIITDDPKVGKYYRKKASQIYKYNRRNDCLVSAK